MTDNPTQAALVERLLPCPFCNKQCACLVIDQGDKWAHYEPACLEVRTGYDLSDAAPWKAEAIAAWNTRPDTTQAARIKVLEDALRDLLSWFPEKPQPAAWNIEAGPHGADDASEDARKALEKTQ